MASIVLLVVHDVLQNADNGMKYVSTHEAYLLDHVEVCFVVVYTCRELDGASIDLFEKHAVF